jgi:hypothetical protein
MTKSISENQSVMDFSFSVSRKIPPIAFHYINPNMLRYAKTHRAGAATTATGARILDGIGIMPTATARARKTSGHHQLGMKKNPSTIKTNKAIVQAPCTTVG